MNEMVGAKELREFYDAYCERTRQFGLIPRSFEWWCELLGQGEIKNELRQ